MKLTSICEGCGLVLQSVEGPTHPYMISSPACWKLYGEVLAREYSDKNYWQVHRLTVDAYALQHPGNDDPRAIQSVNGHLASLYLIFEKNTSFVKATESLAPLIKKHKNRFSFLKRPDKIGDITVFDIWNTDNPEQHIMMVEKWARSVWNAWKDYHEYIEKLLEK